MKFFDIACNVCNNRNKQQTALQISFCLLKQLFYVIQYNFEDKDCSCVFRNLDRRNFTQQPFLFLCQNISVADFMLGKYTSPDTYFSQNW